jgi:hypothetical protein
MLALPLTLGLALVAVADDKAGPRDNTPPPGFTALFNGKDLTGWQGLLEVPDKDPATGRTRRVPLWLTKLSPEEKAAQQKEANQKYLPHWTVRDGVLHYDGKGQSLQTAKDYGNFELYVSWKILPRGDSGIYLRGNPQVQIWDSDNARGEDKGKGSGGLWNNPPGSKGKMPLVRADKPIGQWNTFHIIMKGDRATIFLNDQKVVDDAPLANYWEKSQPLPAKGPIELQHHGDELWFKNIYIRELPD